MEVRKAFQIGFNRCGTKFICSLFRQNGYKVRHWENGALAEDIFYSKAKSRPPFLHYEDVTLFSDMESVHRPGRPFLEGFREFKYLHSHYPDAIFILNERSLENWLISRLTHQGGAYRKWHSNYLGVRENELPEIWAADWEDHVSSCVNYFSGVGNFVRYNIDLDAPCDFAKRLQPWFNLTVIPENGEKRSLNDHRKRADEISAILYPMPVRALSEETLNEKNFVDSLVGFSVGTGPSIDRNDYAPSRAFSKWDGCSRLERPSSDDLELAVFECRGREFVLLPRGAPKGLERVEAALNDIVGLGRRMELAVDMQDARRGAVSNEANGCTRVLTYNRKQGSAGLTLWPLLGYHNLGNSYFFSEHKSDKVEFEDKIDQLVWRGNLTGRAIGAKAGHGRKRSSIQILKDIENGAGSHDDLLNELSRVPRFSFVQKHMGEIDFDIGLVLGRRFHDLSNKEPLEKCCVSARPIEFFHRYRYVACISGHDGPSNFPMALMSNSVVLKEEDGWELFYSGSFRPWEHYVPLAPGLGDVEEKLEWARANDAACREMVRARHPICQLFSRRDLRRQFFNGVLDQIE